jgi:hypothetical protein
MMSGLVGFVINIVALLAGGAIFFLSIDKVAPDAFFAKIGKIAVGALLIIALVITVASIFGYAGGLAIAPLGVIYFAIAVIIAVAVLYIINLVIDWIATNMGMGGGWVVPVKYILGVIVLVGLLIAAVDLLFGAKALPFRTGAASSITVASDSASAPVHL